MSGEQEIDPGHDDVRKALRAVGPAVAAVGVGFIAVGMFGFFSAFGTFQPPRHFWCMFVGMPLLGIGIAITKFAYMGPFFRYMMGETAPVAKDTFNYMARGTTPGVRDISRAVGRGFAEGSGARERTDPDASCPKCGAEGVPADNFCGHCGAALARPDEPRDRGAPEV